MNIVYCIVSTLLILILIFLTSKVQIRINNLSIQKVSFDELSHQEIDYIFTIIELINDEQYAPLLDYFDINIKIYFCLLSILPIKIITIDTLKLKKFIIKQQNKSRALQAHNKEKYKKMINKNNKLKKAITKNIPKLNLELLEAESTLGFENAKLTAITVGLLNSIISIILLNFYENNLHKLSKAQNLLSIKPTYNKVFYLSLKLKATISFKFI